MQTNKKPRIYLSQNTIPESQTCNASIVLPCRCDCSPRHRTLLANCAICSCVSAWGFPASSRTEESPSPEAAELDRMRPRGLRREDGGVSTADWLRFEPNRYSHPTLSIGALNLFQRTEPEEASDLQFAELCVFGVTTRRYARRMYCPAGQREPKQSRTLLRSCKRMAYHIANEVLYALETSTSFINKSYFSFYCFCLPRAPIAAQTLHV